MQNIFPCAARCTLPDRCCAQRCDSRFGYLAEQIVSDQTQCMPYHGILCLSGLSPCARRPLTLQDIRAEDVRLRFQPCSGQTIEIFADCLLCDSCSARFHAKAFLSLPVDCPIRCCNSRDGMLRLGAAIEICQAEFCGCDKMRVHLQITVRWIVTQGPCAIVANKSCQARTLPLYPKPIAPQGNPCCLCACNLGQSL